VQRITVRGAPDAAVARAVGKALANALLWKCALAGNDPNVGRILQAVGDELGNQHPHLATGRVRIELAGRPIVVDGVFQLDRATETALIAAFRDAELYPLVAPADGLTFKPPVDFPRHERSVPVLVDLGLGSASATVFGNDLTHEYVTENADYRS
jgi:glutamate N-acetyltransferase/amino-acid N-acetyltransferase